MSITCDKIVQKIPDLLEFVSGNENTPISDVDSPESGLPGTLVFAHQNLIFEKALNTPCAAIVFNKKEISRIKNLETQKTLIASPNPTLAMAFVIQEFFFKKRILSGIHARAVIDSTAKIGKEVFIGPNSVIGPNVIIGDYSQVHSNVTIEENVTIGSHSIIMSNAFVGWKTQIGNNVEIKPGAIIGSDGFGFTPDKMGHFHRIPQRGTVVIEDDVSIGANTCIDRATFHQTRICKGSKLDNLIQVGHNCKIGSHGVFSGGSVFAGSTEIGNHVMIGGQSALGGHLKITDNVQIGGRSGFAHDVEKPGAYSGHPLLPLKEYLRVKVLYSRLPEIFKDVKLIKEKLNLKE